MIIGLSAKKQGGKTTTSEFLKVLFHKEKSIKELVKIVSFAEKLKKIVLDCFVPYDWDISIEDLKLEEVKNKFTPCGKTIRELLQIIGTDQFRNLYEDVWVNCLFNDILDSPNKNFIINDVRFPNELKAVQEMGGIVIRLLRSPLTDLHKSETALDEVERNTLEDLPGLKFDYIIDNKNCETFEEAKKLIEKCFYDLELNKI